MAAAYAIYRLRVALYIRLRIKCYRLHANAKAFIMRTEKKQGSASHMRILKHAMKSAIESGRGLARPVWEEKCSDMWRG